MPSEFLKASTKYTKGFLKDKLIPCIPKDYSV